MPGDPTTTSSSSSSSTTAKEPSYILHRTPWIPPVAVRGEGSYLYLEDGTKLLDAVGGAAVACIGTSHPKVVKAIKDQLDELPYVYNMQLSNKPAEALAKNIVDRSNGAFAAVGFASGGGSIPNSFASEDTNGPLTLRVLSEGSEAMEGVLKLARQYFVEIGQPQRSNFIGRQLSFHGNTLATLSVAYHPARRAPYAALLDTQNYHHVSPAYAKRFQKPGETEEQYVERLRKELEDKFIALGPDTVIGFVAETVVGATTGVVSAPKGYFKAMKSVCDKYGALFILDEVMSGMGRMGTLHGWQSLGDGCAPDLQAVAKGLGGGYASIGAVLMSPKVVEGIRGKSGLWKHGHTYQACSETRPLLKDAHPLACAASLAVQQVIEEENLLENIREQGAYLGKLLRERLTSPTSLAAPFTFDIRGAGGFWGVEFDLDRPEAASLNLKGERFGSAVQAKALQNGLVVMGFSGGGDLEGNKGDHIVIAPAYNITKEQVETIVDLLVKSVEEVLKDAGL